MRRRVQIGVVVLAVVVGAYLSYLALRQEKGPSGASVPSTVPELPAISRSEVTITCGPTIVGARGDLFGTSLNVPRWTDASRHSVDWGADFLGTTQEALADHIKIVGPGVKVRFGYQPFDGYLDPSGKVVPGYQWREALDGKNGQMPLDRYFDYLAKVGGEPQIVVNLATGSAGDAADLVAYVNGSDPGDPMVALRRSRGRAEPYGVKAFEIGAETWSRQSAGYDKFAGGTTGSRDASALGARINEFASAMRKRSPTPVKLYAPVTDWQLDTWPDATLKKLIASVAPNVDGYALSFFASDAKGESVDVPAAAASSWRLGQKIAELRGKIADAAKGHSGEVVMSQWAGSPYESVMGRNWLTGLALVDSFVTMAEQGVTGSNYFAASAPPGASAEYSYWLDGDPSRPAPTLVATEVTARHFGRELLETEMTNVASVSLDTAAGHLEVPSIASRCSRRDYDAFMIAVNRTSKPHKVNVELKFAVVAPIDSTQLVAPTSAQSVDVDRVTYQPAGKFSIELPSYSATYLRLPLA